jgi:hypothetical protein
MVQELKIVLHVVKLRNPRAQSIKVLSLREEIGLACQLSLIFVSVHIRVITDKIS